MTQEQIMRKFGMLDTAEALAISNNEKRIELERRVLRTLVGPDVFWRPIDDDGVSGAFGRLDVSPFPFRAIFRPDEPGAPLVHLETLSEIQHLVAVNEEGEVLLVKQTRLALRALDGQVIIAPHIEQASSSSWTRYNTGRLSIERNCDVKWRDYNYSSGFRVRLAYSDGHGIDSSGKPFSRRKLTVDGTAIGVTPEFLPNERLARVFQLNHGLLAMRVPALSHKLDERRRFLFDEAQWKLDTLSYAFALRIFADSNLSKTPDTLQQRLDDEENAAVVRELPTRYRAAVTYACERMRNVTRNDATASWYIVWDDWVRANVGQE